MMSFWRDQRVLVAIYVVAALLASLGKYFKQPVMVDGRPVTHYNNYIIFKNAGLHLAENKNLYLEWREEQGDVYKYSPTFAGAIWPISRLPDLVGLCLWNVANALILLWAIRSLPLAPHMATLAAWLVFKDSLTSLQNAQSNGIVAAMMILTVIYWERNRPLAAGLAIAVSLYMKIFGVAVAMMWFMYPHKAKNFAASIFVALLVGLIPLAITSPDMLWQQYVNWYDMLRDEFPASEGISVMGMLHAWFGITGHKSWMVLLGGLILMAPLLRTKCYHDLQFRLGLLASTMIWVVLFNHRAESPTFVIATAGVAIWFVSRPITRMNIALMTLTIILSGFSNSDIMPDWVQANILERYQLKALPSLLVWFKLQTEMWSLGETKTAAQSVNIAPHQPVLAA